MILSKHPLFKELGEWSGLNSSWMGLWIKSGYVQIYK
jgi:hypothetical protein